MNRVIIIVPMKEGNVMMFKHLKFLRTGIESGSNSDEVAIKAAREKMGVEGFVNKFKELEFLPGVALDIFTVDVRQQTDIKNREEVSLEDAKRMSDSGKIGDVCTSLAIQLLYSANKRV